MAASSFAHPRPTQVFDQYWITQDGPNPYRNETVLGKWLIFSSLDTVDDTWEQIRQSVENGQVHAAAAKVCTQMPNPLAGASKNKVICVYTSEERVNEVGLLLMNLECVQRQKTIRYKTDQATMDGRYASLGHKKVTSKALYWDNGQPKFSN